jgi:transcriptional regulator with XRE-family HTH domain
VQKTLDNLSSHHYAHDMKSKELRKWRLDNGYTQEQLAVILGVTVFTISRWESETSGIPSFLHLALTAIPKRVGIKKKGSGKH